MESDIVNGLQMLEDRLQQLRTLLEWRKLHDEERPINGLELRRADPTLEEISAAYGSFISLALELQQTLAQTTGVLPDLKHEWDRQLRHLILQCDALRVPETFINP